MHIFILTIKAGSLENHQDDANCWYRKVIQYQKHMVLTKITGIIYGVADNYNHGNEWLTVECPCTTKQDADIVHNYVTTTAQLYMYINAYMLVKSQGVFVKKGLLWIIKLTWAGHRVQTSGPQSTIQYPAVGHLFVSSASRWTDWSIASPFSHTSLCSSPASQWLTSPQSPLAWAPRNRS